MFIKEAYERRLKLEKRHDNEGEILQQSNAKIHKIGSIKNGKSNYDKDEQFFSPDDMPFPARLAKEEVKLLIDPVSIPNFYFITLLIRTFWVSEKKNGIPAPQCPRTR